MPSFPLPSGHRPLATVALLLMPFSPVSAALDFDTLKSRNPRPPAAHIVEVTHQNGRWIAGADGGYITHSSDGESWSTVTVAYGKAIESVIYWNGAYYAGGVDARTLLTSSDLVNWAPLNVWSTGYPFNLREFHVAFGKLFAVGYSPGLAVTADGADWTEITFSVDDARFESMASNGTRAVLVGGDALIMTSEDGVSWTPQSVTIAGVESSIDDDFLSVRWVNGQFVAGGKQGLLATSPDGLTWTHHPTDWDDWLYTCVDVDGTYVFPGRQGRFRTTTDFADWAEIDAGTNQDWGDLFMAGDRIVAGGRDGYVAFSDNLSEWTVTNNGNRAYLGAIAYGADVYVVSDFNGAAWKSNDSASWVRVFEDPDSSSFAGLLWDGARFVAVNDDGYVVTSPEGENWTRSGAPFTTRRVESFSQANGLYWAVGEDGLIASSADLNTWNELTVGDHHFYSLCRGDGLYLATGFKGDRSGGVIYTSPDGVEWTERDPGYPEADGFRIYGCAFGNGRYVAAGSSRSLTHSPDGITWTHETSVSSTPFNLNGIHFIDGQFVGTASGGSIWWSDDGIAWTQKRLRTTQGIYGWVEAGGRTVVIGTNGTILSTDLDLGHTYASWKAERFSPAQQIDDTISGPGEDPDEDGRTNAFEYFSNTQPLVADPRGPYTLKIVEISGVRYSGVSLRRGVDLVDIALDIQSSATLADWTSLTGEQILEETVTPLDDETEEVLFRRVDAIDAAEPEFLRIQTVIAE